MKNNKHFLSDPLVHSSCIWTSIKAEGASKILEDLCYVRAFKYGEPYHIESGDKRFFE